MDRVGRVDHHGLGRPAEELARMRHEPLVELVFAGDEQ